MPRSWRSSATSSSPQSAAILRAVRPPTRSSLSASAGSGQDWRRSDLIPYVNATPFDLSGRAALVTGCGSEAGIGFACARMLARLGARVAITSTTERIEERAGELRAEGAEVSSHVADLTDREQAFALVEAAGAVDILANSAGLAQTGVDMPFPRI